MTLNFDKAYTTLQNYRIKQNYRLYILYVQIHCPKDNI